MCTSPSTPTSSADQPITILAVSALWSGCRNSRHASSTSRIGIIQSPAPNNVRMNVPSGWLIPPACHQVATAQTMAAVSAASPAPSLRCIGSSSLALASNVRATAPTECARAIQIPASAATTHRPG